MKIQLLELRSRPIIVALRMSAISTFRETLEAIPVQDDDFSINDFKQRLLLEAVDRRGHPLPRGAYHVREFFMR